MDGPNTHVRDTLLLGATRIGHGVSADAVNQPGGFGFGGGEGFAFQQKRRRDHRTQFAYQADGAPGAGK